MKKRKVWGCFLLCVVLASGLLACSNGNVQEDLESGAEANEADDSVELVGTTNSDEVQETYEGPGPDEEEVYEELVVEDEYDVYGKGTYQAMWDGIYRIAEDGSRECIYEGHVGTEPHMAVHNGILYFKTYLEWQDGYMDWIDTGIRMVNLATLQNDIVDIGENRIVRDFYIENESGLAVIIDMGGKDGYLFIPFDNTAAVWNPPDDEMMRELWKLEDTGLAIQTAKKLTENVGMMEEVAFRTEEGVTALMDLELDGEPERVTFDGTAVDPYAWRQWNHYELSVNGEKLYEGEGAFVYPKIWFLSLDGKGLLIAIYDDGPSSDPTTTLLRYADGEIIEVGKFDDDILTCEISSDGVIHGDLRKDVIQTDWVRASWQLSEENMLEQIPTGDIVEFRNLNEVELMAEVTLATEPNGQDTFVVEASEAEPQIIVFTRATADSQWIELTMTDGVKGWLALANGKLADGRSVFDVFRNLNMAD